MVAYARPTAIIPPKIATCYQFAFVVAPADNTQFSTGPVAALWCGAAGAITVVMRNGDGQGGVTPVTFQDVPAGMLLPIGVQGVNATGTTMPANTIIALG